MSGVFDEHAALNSGRSNMIFIFGTGFSNSVPDFSHELIMAFPTVVESLICLSERVGFLSTRYKKTIRG